MYYKNWGHFNTNFLLVIQSDENTVQIASVVIADAYIDNAVYQSC